MAASPDQVPGTSLAVVLCDRRFFALIASVLDLFCFRDDLDGAWHDLRDCIEVDSFVRGTSNIYRFNSCSSVAVDAISEAGTLFIRCSVVRALTDHGQVGNDVVRFFPPPSSCLRCPCCLVLLLRQPLLSLYLLILASYLLH